MPRNLVFALRLVVLTGLVMPLLGACSGIDWQASIRQSLSNACKASRHCGSNGIPEAD
ncbi:hypothetical protein [Thalassospira marina]|uniref:hypothetical protein n=1 Tax=Thalassospira marina TaxID=2048283 RepID=UPI0013FD1B69|nr:hypothetical protein [Thalassospira marina]